MGAGTPPTEPAIVTSEPTAMAWFVKPMMDGVTMTVSVMEFRDCADKIAGNE